MLAVAAVHADLEGRESQFRRLMLTRWAGIGAVTIGLVAAGAARQPCSSRVCSSGGGDDADRASKGAQMEQRRRRRDGAGHALQQQGGELVCAAGQGLGFLG